MVRLSPPERLGEFFGLYGLVGKGARSSASCCTARRSSCCLGPLGNGAYQVAVLSLLVTMFIGLWLVWPVRDDWAGVGERGVARHGAAAGPPGAERLAPR